MSSEKEKHKDWTNGEDGGSFSCVSENKGRKESTLMFSAPLSWHPIASPHPHPPMEFDNHNWGFQNIFLY